MSDVTTKKLLEGLIKNILPLAKLQKRVQQKYKLTKKELFEVRKKGKKQINSYISKDGRYIIVE